MARGEQQAFPGLFGGPLGRAISAVIAKLDSSGAKAALQAWDSAMKKGEKAEKASET